MSAPASTRHWDPLPADFYGRTTLETARDLLGRVLVHRHEDGLLAGRIVEVEAYHQDGDRAAHSYGGPTNRNRVMFGPPGHLYVYLIYGIHFCMNVVTETDGTGAAVLIRALEPLEGEARMQQFRGARVTRRNLTNGPGKCCQAFAIDRRFDGIDLRRGPIELLQGEPVPDSAITSGPRIGITKSADLPWRFWLEGNPFVSR